MWTPKRVMLLAVSFALFLAAYVVYAHVLGGIDGLPPLPERYKASRTDIRPDFRPPEENAADQKLRVAFGNDCEESRRKFKLELQPQGVVLAAEESSIDKFGRVKLTPFSVAIFGKKKESYPEITTIQSQVAYLTFDKPLSNIFEMSSRKITATELEGDISVTNNRGTPERTDDISLTTQGPLHYVEARNQIYTDKTVKLMDFQSKPKPTEIIGTGLDIYLSPDAKNSGQAHAPNKAKQDSGPPIQSIDLRANVEMNLWTDSRSGFLGGTKDSAKPAKPANGPTGAAPPEEPRFSKVVILTEGPFHYDWKANNATFDISRLAGNRPNIVQVNRVNGLDGKQDLLECDHLEMQFRRRAPALPAGAAAPPGPARANEQRPESLEIETVHAIGKEVKLHSDEENLVAYGTDFAYDRTKHISTLRGNPRMSAIKEGNIIEAPELQMYDQRGAQNAVAIGEGWIRLLDKNTHKHNLEARWKRQLIYEKDGEHDVLTLIGDGTFLDTERAQQLRAQHLKVTLEPMKTPLPNGGQEERRRPRRVEAVGQVALTSAEMVIHDTERLVIWFKDAPAGAAPPPTASADPGGPAGGLLGQNPVQAPAANGEPAKAKKPIDLSARSIDAHVLRNGPKNDLNEVWCEGRVVVHQDPANPGDKGVDIRGETLKLTHQPDGNVLDVTGNSADDRARVQMDKIFIVGPKVVIDQTTNFVTVDGPGAMSMPSNKGFDGAPLGKESDLHVGWEERMEFDGQDARFLGKIQADQDTGHLLCNSLQVTLDRKVSLREGNKASEPAKVQKLVCDRDVILEDTKFEKNKLVSYRRIDCPELAADNDAQEGDSQLNAVGPGLVRIFQPGSGTETLPVPGNGPATPQQGGTAKMVKNQPKPNTHEEFKLTIVQYKDRMWANNKKNQITFSYQVLFLQFPADRPDVQVDPLHPPQGYLLLNCGKLDVRTSKKQDGTTKQELQALGKVSIEGATYSGHCEELAYDQEKEQIILKGSPGNPAVLHTDRTKGKAGKEIVADKIMYYRLTGDFTGEGVHAIK